MSTLVQPPAGAGETIRNVTGTMVWLSEPLRADVDLERYKALREGLAPLVEEFHRRFAELAKDYPEDDEIDPDDIAVPILEKAEEYFDAQRVELRHLRSDLVRKGYKERIGELDQLDDLYRRLAIILEEARWTILIHDGQASEVAGTIRGRDDLIKFLRDDSDADS